MRLSFGDCILDGETRELTRRGERVHVSPRAFQFLELLLTERPRAISKEEILERLWSGVHVTDGTLTTIAAEARSAIGDDAQEPRFIRTLHRFGYAFSGPAEEGRKASGGKAPLPRVAWRLIWETREIGLSEGETILGRDPDSGILIDHGSVSRHHAKITVSGDRATLEDLGSKNGTFRAGGRLEEPTQLTDRDQVRFGSVDMTVRVLSIPATTETTPEIKRTRRT